MNTSLTHARDAAVRMICGGALALACVSVEAAPELGVFSGHAWEGPPRVEEFSKWLGRPVVVATGFYARENWDQVVGKEWNLGYWRDWVRAQPGRNVSQAVPPIPETGATLAECAAGKYDAYYVTMANNLAYYGLHWAYLRLGWEMDGDWYPWGAPPGSGKEASFAGCFRRVVQVMRLAQPANQWKFVLNPTMNWWDKSYLDAIWPGDAYVDVVAIDLYDQSWAPNTYPFPNPCDAACRLTRQQNAWNNYLRLLNMIRDFAVAHGKTVAIPEWATGTRADGHAGGDNPYFIQKMSEFINDPANRVAYQSYFDGPGDAVWDNRLSGTTNNPQAAAMFKKLFGPVATNTPPTVSITSPTAGQTVYGTMAFAANATDNAGVSRVDFFLDSTAVLSDATAPYGGSFDTTKIANGAHVVRAIAYDSQGLSATSEVSINVQNVISPALSVSFTAPVANARLSGTISQSACEVRGTGISRVVFFMDATQLNTATAAPWSCTVDTRDFANRSHTLRAVAYSANGASTTVTRKVFVRN